MESGLVLGLDLGLRKGDVWGGGRGVAVAEAEASEDEDKDDILEEECT